LADRTNAIAIALTAEQGTALAALRDSLAATHEKLKRQLNPMEPASTAPVEDRGIDQNIRPEIRKRAEAEKTLEDKREKSDDCKPVRNNASQPAFDVSALTKALVEAACADLPTVPYVIRGLAKRMVDSLDPALFDKDADPDPAQFLELMGTKKMAGEPNLTCLARVDKEQPDLIWQLTLAAKVYETERSTGIRR
jgi:hypothetical protein